MAEAVDSVNVSAFVSIHAALDCLNNKNPAALTVPLPLSQRRYDRSTLDHLRNQLIAINARCRGQVDCRPPQWIELVDFHFDYRDFRTPKGKIYVLVAVSEATYPAAEIEDRSAPQHHPDAVEARYCLVVRNLTIETAVLLQWIKSLDVTPSRSGKEWLIEAMKSIPPDGIGWGSQKCYAQKLEREMAAAAKTNKKIKPLTWKTIQSRLSEIGKPRPV